MDLAQRYQDRTQMLLRLIDPEDLGHLVHAEARREICRILHLTEEPPIVVCDGDSVGHE